MRTLPESMGLTTIKNAVIVEAMKSTCLRSKCGAIIVNDFDDTIVGRGWNALPGYYCCAPTECIKDKLPDSFKSDRTCCIHAEQAAIIDALSKKGSNHRLVGCSLYFIRLDLNNKVMFAGKPYCSICSKMALEARLEYFCLYHEQGWVAYGAKEYNDLTFQYK